MNKNLRDTYNRLADHGEKQLKKESVQSDDELKVFIENAISTLKNLAQQSGIP
jgi:hypothetical protein